MDCGRESCEYPLMHCSLTPIERSISTQENKNGIGPDGERTFGTNFLFQFEPVICNPNNKELKYFQLFWFGGVDNTRWKKV